MASNASSKDTKKNHWINWFVPVLLLLTALAFLLFYPKPNDKPIISQTNIKPSNTSTDIEFKANKLSNSLVSTFFYGTEEDKIEQVRALEITLEQLNSEPSDKTQTALSDLKNNNINNAIETLASLASQQNNLRKSAKTWVHIGNIQNLTSADQALMAYQKASELDSTNPEAWNRQGHIHRQLKQFTLAEVAYKKARSLGTTGIADKALSLANFGLLNQSKGKLKEAEIAFLNALNIYKKVDNEQGIASTSENLANVYKNLGSLDKAETYYLTALALHAKTYNFQNMAALNTTLGILYQKKKHPEKAQTHYEIALRISQENSFKGNFANLYNKLALLAQQNGDLKKSQRYFEKSLSFSNDLKQSVGSANQYGKLAITNRNQKKYNVAEDYHKKAITIYQQNNHINGVISQKINLGFLYKVWQKKQLACDIWHDSLTLLKSTKSSRTDRIAKLLQDNNCQ